MANQATVSISHFGICCSDVQRSADFYSEALGFELAVSIDNLGSPFDILMELPGAELSVRQMKCGEVTIELIGYPQGEVVGSAERRPTNQLGFTHMTLVVDDVDAVAARIAQCGGTVHAQTRIDSHFGPIVFCTDPDGVRIELMQPPG
ncbi:MAG: putative enzyme related to lactoylglutathione lyase [Halieaceae bacterium]|jgi:predicted enzyme related to lactoylglutathione lyase